MNKIRFLTAGESHGQALGTVIEGLPAGLSITEEEIRADLSRRQRGYGRGGRMQIEKDFARILSGVRYGKTLGSPVMLLLENKDWPNWTEKMSVAPVDNPVPKLQMPRPGHADYAGMIKYQHDDLRNLLERSSARETAMRVAVGAVCRKFLAEFGIRIYGHVVRIGKVTSSFSALTTTQRDLKDPDFVQGWDQVFERVEAAEMACADQSANEKMMALVDDAKERGTSLGGQFEIVATGVPIGLGSHVHWDRKLDGQVAYAMMSINAMKCVEIGMGINVGTHPGSMVHDQLYYSEDKGYFRSTNNAGGIEGGMSNGEPIVARVTMKPLPTMVTPLQSVDVSTREPKQAHYERADVCAVPAAVIVGEAMLAIVLANALADKLGGDSIDEMKRNMQGLPHVPMGW